MATSTAGRPISPRRQARRALRNAVTRAETKPTAEEKVTTLLRGIATAQAWLDGSHKKLAQA